MTIETATSRAGNRGDQSTRRIDLPYHTADRVHNVQITLLIRRQAVDESKRRSCRRTSIAGVSRTASASDARSRAGLKREPDNRLVLIEIEKISATNERGRVGERGNIAGNQAAPAVDAPNAQ